MSIYSRKNPPPGFYVYAYLREDGTPYYIGKGSSLRAWKSHEIKLPKNRKQSIIFLETNLTEIGSLALERFYIRWYGRKDLGTGILRNMTDGGDGATNIIPWNKGKPRTEEEKKNISKSLIGKVSWNKGVPCSEETKAKLRGQKRTKETIEKLRQISLNQIRYPHTEETKRKISQSHIGKIVSEETKMKMRKPKSKAICPHCGLLGGTNNIYRWHFDNCKKRVNNSE